MKKLLTAALALTLLAGCSSDDTTYQVTQYGTDGSQINSWVAKDLEQDGGAVKFTDIISEEEVIVSGNYKVVPL